MKITDILGAGKIMPFDKLVGVLEKIGGRLSKQYFDKKDIDTKAYEIRVLAEARAAEMKTITVAITENNMGIGSIEYKEEKLQISSPNIDSKQFPSLDLESRTKERLLFQQAHKQLNIENITSIAAEQLKDEPAIDDKPIDEDWLSRFVNIAEDISSEELQMLWGKILAGEIKKPNSYSFRTLELIRNLTKDEASLITKVANLSFNVSGIYGFFRGNDKAYVKHGISYSEIVLLIEIGIIQPNETLGITFNSIPLPSHTSLYYGDLLLVIERDANMLEQHLPIAVFTKAGAEILSLLTVTTSLPYLQEIANFIKKPGTSTKYATIVKDKDGHLRHSLPLLDL